MQGGGGPTPPLRGQGVGEDRPGSLVEPTWRSWEGPDLARTPRQSHEDRRNSGGDCSDGWNASVSLLLALRVESNAKTRRLRLREEAGVGGGNGGCGRSTVLLTSDGGSMGQSLTWTEFQVCGHVSVH